MTDQARHDYTLAYAPNNKSASFHTLRVTTSPSYTATTRSGYYKIPTDTPTP
jgi:hypothetical protein